MKPKHQQKDPLPRYIPESWYALESYVNQDSASMHLSYQAARRLAGPAITDDTQGHPLKDPQELENLITQHGLWLISDETNERNCTREFISETTFFQARKTPESYYYLITSNDYKVLESFEILKTLVSKNTDKSGELYALVITKESLEKVQIGTPGRKLNIFGYSSPCYKQYSEAVEDLNSKDPKGRLVLLSGEPGTGKSYMVRSFLSEASGTYILVPPHMLASMGDPSYLPGLLALRENHDSSLVFIVEDADSCLCPRGADNMSSIAAILNLTDGLLGESLDIRIIASTNAKKVDIDPALLRPGRLSVSIETTKLSREEGVKFFQELGVTAPDPTPSTLAALYEIARANGWKPPKKEEVKPKRRSLW